MRTVGTRYDLLKGFPNAYLHQNDHQRKHKSVDSIHEKLGAWGTADATRETRIAVMDEWNVTGAAAVPMEKVRKQRESHFKGIRFRDIEQLLEDAKVMQIV